MDGQVMGCGQFGAIVLTAAFDCCICLPAFIAVHKVAQNKNIAFFGQCPGLFACSLLTCTLPCGLGKVLDLSRHCRV